MELHRDGRRVRGEYHVGLQQGGIDGRLEGNARAVFSFEGRTRRLPAAKFATIAEHVWLLEKTGAPEQFLVFGNDREVPLRWLDRFGDLVAGVQFYFLADDGRLEVLR